jgi:SAM-dependent methyltransferase
VSVYEYVGDELALFARAHNWKRYLRAQIAPFLRGRVLEVGAGLGATTQALLQPGVAEWVGLEPDERLARSLRQKIDAGVLPPSCRVVVGTLDGYRETGFDAILYIDVLEHIERDDLEIARAADRLVAGGHLVVLSPAHPFLFSPFDRAIGHYRRYTKRMLAALTPASLDLVRLRYLDAVGFAASAANRWLLRAAMPTERQIRFWDRLMVPASRVLDPLGAHRFGKSVLAVGQRAARDGGSGRAAATPHP